MYSLVRCQSTLSKMESYTLSVVRLLARRAAVIMECVCCMSHLNPMYRACYEQVAVPMINFTGQIRRCIVWCGALLCPSCCKCSVVCVFKCTCLLSGYLYMLPCLLYAVSTYFCICIYTVLYLHNLCIIRMYCCTYVCTGIHVSSYICSSVCSKWPYSVCL